MPICTANDNKKPHIYKDGEGWCVSHQGAEFSYPDMTSAINYCYYELSTEGKNKTDKALRQQCLAKRHEKGGKDWT